MTTETDRPVFALRHPTVVPTNFEPEDGRSTDDDAVATDPAAP